MWLAIQHPHAPPPTPQACFVVMEVQLVAIPRKFVRRASQPPRPTRCSRISLFVRSRGLCRE